MPHAPTASAPSCVYMCSCVSLSTTWPMYGYVPRVHADLPLEMQRHVERIGCSQHRNADNHEHHAYVGPQAWYCAPLPRVDLPKPLEHVGSEVLPGVWLRIVGVDAPLRLLRWGRGTLLGGATHHPHVWQRKELEPRANDLVSVLDVLMMLLRCITRTWTHGSTRRSSTAKWGSSNIMELHSAPHCCSQLLSQ